ncbi:MAG: nicotinic acid mononucleotide adenylyltransferase, partial [Hyphococcus sp.]
RRPGFAEPALESEAAEALGAFRVDEADAGRFLEREPPAWIFFSNTDNPLSSTEIRNRLRQPKETPDT